MCVGAALFGTAKIGAGISAATAFNIGLGLTAANAFIGRAAARSQAEQTYQSALLENRSAEAAKRLKQQALEERQSEETKSAAQDMFAKNIQALQASRAIIASEQAGTTIGLLLMDTERQAANYRERINQSLESMQRQYLFNVQATESQFEGRRNQLQSNINEAYNAIPSLGQTLLNIGTQGVGMYFNALP